MQRITGFWKSGTVGKVVILVGSLFTCCCACLGTSSVMNSMGLLPTAVPTAIPTNTILPTNTPSPEPTETPTSTVIADLYYSEMLARIDAYLAAYEKFAAQHQRLSDNSDVLKDIGWKLDMGSALAELQVAAEDLQTIPDKTPRYEKLDGIFALLGVETVTMIMNYTTAVDRLDTTYLDQAGVNLTNMNEYFRQATDELKVLNSSTSPLAPLATVPSIPTATIIFIPPTAVQGNCHPSYPDVCIPYPPPDLDCPEIPFRNFRIVGPDVHRLDGSDNDNIGCES